MKTTRYLIRQLSAAEVGQTDTNEIYVRCPNDFDYQDFFQQEGEMVGTVLVINFTAVDLTEGETIQRSSLDLPITKTAKAKRDVSLA